MMWRRSFSRPGDGGLPAFSQSSRDAPPFQARVVKPRISDLDPAALQRAGQDVGADRGHHDRPAAHRAGIVDQQGDHRVAELGVLLLLERQRRGGVDDHPGQARDVQHALLEVEAPGAVLLGQQPALQAVGQARDDVGQAGQLLVEIGAQAGQLLGVAQLLGRDDLVVAGGEDLVGAARRWPGSLMSGRAGLLALADLELLVACPRRSRLPRPR